MATLKSGAPAATFRLDGIDPDFARAEVRFEGLEPPADSFEVRVFLDEPSANARTPTDRNPRYIGSQYFYGSGSSRAPSGSRASAARAKQLAATDIRLNVTDALRTFLASAKTKSAPVTLVAVDNDGKEIAEPGLRFDRVSLATTAR
jgi:tyrosinase